jgi:hypothetical protein
MMTLGLYRASTCESTKNYLTDVSVIC